jgi:hypothetical protein
MLHINAQIYIYIYIYTLITLSSLINFDQCESSHGTEHYIRILLLDKVEAGYEE